MHFLPCVICAAHCRGAESAFWRCWNGWRWTRRELKVAAQGYWRGGDSARLHSLQCWEPLPLWAHFWCPGKCQIPVFKSSLIYFFLPCHTLSVFCLLFSDSHHWTQVNHLPWLQCSSSYSHLHRRSANYGNWCATNIFNFVIDLFTKRVVKWY